jgi:protein-disulfide isomerase
MLVAAVALVTLASATMLYRAKRLPAPGRGEERDTNRTQSKLERAGPIHLRGNPNAPVTLEEFGDFQCPPCGGLAGVIKQIEQDYGDRLCVIFNHFPLPTHLHAREAALAAEAAGMQDRFWEMHDLLYREQSVWSTAADARALFSSYAGLLGLNIDRFNKDMESEKAKARIASDQKRGATLGVTNTPTIFINDNALAPASLSASGLRAGIKRAINVKSPP